MYMLILILMIWAGTANAQIQVIQFNAEWNKANEVDWIQDLDLRVCEDVLWIIEDVKNTAMKLFKATTIKNRIDNDESMDDANKAYDDQLAKLMYMIKESR